MKNVLCIVLSLVLLTGCAILEANVSSFSELPKNLIGKTIYVQAYPQKKNNTLEWKSYRKIFENGFEKVGFTIASMESADYIAFVSYGISGGSREITMDIVLRETLQDENPTKVYEGRLTSSGYCGVLQEVMDEMVEALFQKFPNGQGSVTVPGVFDC